MADLCIERWAPDEATPSGGWWAVCDRCDDDAGPYPPVAMFRKKKQAEAYIRSEDPDDAECKLVLDACVAPAVVLGDGTVVVATDYAVKTHADLVAALGEAPVGSLDIPIFVDLLGRLRTHVAHAAPDTPLIIGYDPDDDSGDGGGWRIEVGDWRMWGSAQQVLQVVERVVVNRE